MLVNPSNCRCGFGAQRVSWQTRESRNNTVTCGNLVRDRGGLSFSEEKVIVFNGIGRRVTWGRYGRTRVA